MSLYTLAWMQLAALTLAVDEPPYCSVRYKRLCQGKGRHVACEFPHPGPGTSCLQYSTIKFTNDMKNFILYYINRRRQKLAAGNEKVRGGIRLPKPEVMMYVEWDRELAFLAQRLADQCNFIHDECRATVRYPYAGQTVGEVRWRRTGEPEQRDARRAIRRVLDAWWGERRRATPGQLTAPFRVAARGAVWGHFSQLCVWNLHAMGCGAVRYGALPRLLLVCDFSHTNMLGQRTYRAGALAACPLHSRRGTQFPLLCAPVRRPLSLDSETGDDDEEDFTADPAPTSVSDLTTPSILYSRTTWIPTKNLLREEIRATKGVLVDKLDHALGVRKKVVDKGGESIIEMNWVTRKKSLPWREQLEFSVVPLQRQTSIRHFHGQDSFAPFITLEKLSEGTQPTEENFVRHRWRQTSDRPLRPGVQALLMSTVNRSSPRPRLHSGVSLMLDKEDVEQLFRDTGFKVEPV